MESNPAAEFEEKRAEKEREELAELEIAEQKLAEQQAAENTTTERRQEGGRMNDSRTTLGSRPKNCSCSFAD